MEDQGGKGTLGIRIKKAEMKHFLFCFLQQLNTSTKENLITFSIKEAKPRSKKQILKK